MTEWDERKDMGWVDGMRESIWKEWMVWEKEYGMKEMIWDEKKDMGWVYGMREKI